MADYTISLNQDEEELLKAAAESRGMSKGEFLHAVVGDAIAPMSGPSWEGQLVLKMLREVNATPGRDFPKSVLFTNMLMIAPGNTTTVLDDGVNDLARLGFVTVNNDKVTLTKAGYDNLV